MTITGGNAIEGGGIFNGFSDSLTLTNMSISGNNASLGGGGIWSGFGGQLTIINSTISNNTVTDSIGGATGGGIHANGFTLTNSTVSGNSTSGGNGSGGGIWALNFVTITGSTITNNSAAGISAGGFRANNTSTVRNTIIAANQNNGSIPDILGNSFVSQGYNLIGNAGSVTAFNQVGDQAGSGPTPLNPMLGPLQNNAGPTHTHHLLIGSPAIDKGFSFGLTTDQRLLTRPVDDPTITPAAGGNNSDIGAFEKVYAITAADVSLGGRVTTSVGRGIRGARVTVEGGSLSSPRTAMTGPFGYFNFEGLTAGETYIITVYSKRYIFNVPTRAVTLGDSLYDFNFTAEP